MGEAGEVVLGLDEVEALRLADAEGLYQEAAALQMGVSRQTFGNIVQSARKKTAEALVYGKIIRIAGGVVESACRDFVCESCQHTWPVPFGTGRPPTCPSCNDSNIHCAADSESGSGSRIRGRRGRCGRTNL
jgi:predicted DNA-binding protein (UPF0251 family)